MIRLFVCQECGCEFEADSRCHPKRCSNCRVIGKRRTWLKYSKTEKGRVATAGVKARYNSTEKGKAVRKRVVDKHNASESHKRSYRKHLQTEKGKATYQRSYNKWSKSEKGRVSSARRFVRYYYSGKGKDKLTAANQIRRTGGVYLPRFREMQSSQESCILCNKPYKSGRKGHQIDHIMAVKICELTGLDGINAHGNLQVLCFDCHVSKSNKDRAEIRRLKIEAAPM